MVKLLEVSIITKGIVIFGGTWFIGKHIIRSPGMGWYLTRISTSD